MLCTVNHFKGIRSQIMGKMISSYIGACTRALGLHSFLIKYGLHNRGLKYVLSLINKIRWRRIELVMIVWPPANFLLDEILSDIRKKTKLLSCQRHPISQSSFVDFVQEVYAIDNATPKKIALKINRLKKPDCCVSILKINIERPTMLVQDSLNTVRCKNVGDLKDGLRAKFRDRIPDYIYDVIIHSTEVDYQNSRVLHLVRKYGESVDL